MDKPISLPTIRRPLARRWLDVRMKFVPVAVYLVGIGMAVYLWNTQWMPQTFTGEVHARIGNVASPLNGMLLDTTVQEFDHVAKDQILGKVVLAPATMAAELAAIRADLLVLRARMTVDGQRKQLDFQQVRLDLLDQQVLLALARSRLRFAENELRRQEQLRSERIVSESVYELALGQRNDFAVEVKERESLVVEMEQALTQFKPAPEGQSQNGDAIDAAIQAQEDRFRESAQTVLRSPINGIVTKIYRNAGENISAGEPLITVSEERSEGIIGFVRQPITFVPKPGDSVLVRTRRGTRRQVAEARILKVGARLEFFTQSLRVRGFDSSQERGLPVWIDVPEQLALYPGELVDLSLKN